MADYKLDMDKRIDVEEVLKDLEHYRPRRRGWVWRQKAKDQKLTPMQVSILASIVSGETLQSQEYSRIAGVYLNRFRKGMKLQADPTIAFCFNYELDRILKKHLTVDKARVFDQLVELCLIFFVRF